MRIIRLPAWVKDQYELKANTIHQSEIKDRVNQPSKYAEFYKIPVNLVNFFLEGHLTPIQPTTNVVVVNIMHDRDCTRFIITTPNGN
jgi:hypothetical protein